MTVRLAPAAPEHQSALRRLDRQVAKEELTRLITGGRVIVALEGQELIGALRWGLLWDKVPFMNLLHVMESRRGAGLGTRLILEWEQARQREGYDAVLTSTMADERAQHLYRRLGYLDCGAVLLPGEPLELLLRKSLHT